MTGPLIFMTTWSVKEGRLEEFKQFITRLLELVQAKEPRMIAFNVFLNEDGPEVTSMQIHPDADSMDLHCRSSRKSSGKRCRIGSSEPISSS